MTRPRWRATLEVPEALNPGRNLRAIQEGTGRFRSALPTLVGHILKGEMLSECSGTPEISRSRMKRRDDADGLVHALANEVKAGTKDGVMAYVLNLRKESETIERGYHQQRRIIVAKAYALAFVLQGKRSKRDEFYADDFWNGRKKDPQKGSILRNVMVFVLGSHDGPDYDRACSYAKGLEEAFVTNVDPDQIPAIIDRAGGLEKLYRAAVDLGRATEMTGGESATPVENATPSKFVRRERDQKVAPFRKPPSVFDDVDLPEIEMPQPQLIELEDMGFRMLDLEIGAVGLVMYQRIEDGPKDRVRLVARTVTTP